MSKADAVVEPKDHGDGKPAVSIPPGSYDSAQLQKALAKANHDDEEKIAEAVASAKTEVEPTPEEEEVVVQPADEAPAKEGAK